MTARRALRPFFVLLSLFAWAAHVEAGLRDIHPRPQQMGFIGSEAVAFTGTPYLIIPDNPTDQEALVRDEAIRLFAQRVGRTLPVVEWSAYVGQTPVIWLGTFARFPQLAAALQNTGLPGLGSVSHVEEYQLVVEDNRVLLGGNNELSLRWGLMSLIQLTSEMMGRLYIDRAYIRDWPDFPKRVATVNSNVRLADQVTWANMITDLSYGARMNEIEWNNADAGMAGSSSYSRTQAAIMGARIRSYGLGLTMSVDRTAYTVSQLYWQEGIPIVGMVMRVTDSAFVPVAQGWGVDVLNGGFESWSGTQPANWTMYRDSLFNYVHRDDAVKHSGSSSVRFDGFTSGVLGDLSLRQECEIGPNRMLRVRFWYKTSNYCGQLYAFFLGTASPGNRYDIRYSSLSCPSTRDWSLFQFDFCTYNAGRALILVGPYCPNGGTVWIDDLALETADLQNIVRREDTPLNVRGKRNNMQMAEGTDFRTVETYGTSYPQYVRQPRLERVAGGRLAVGDTVVVDWSCAPLYGGVRQTQCFSQVEPLLEYQERIRHVDSLVHPDGFKIQINEVSYAGYDAACTSRHLTPGQLVGSYCAQMYQIIQARRPGAPVRIYGDAFDYYVRDPRAMPVTGVTWTVGALQELPTPVEVMCMEDYSTNLDSSLDYFAANQHASVMATALYVSTARIVSAIRAAARHSNCRGTQFYMWQGDCESDLPWKIPLFGDLSWNMGPYIVHDPIFLSQHSDSIRIAAEMWSDSFSLSTPPSIVSASARYRMLPGGSWSTVPMTQVGSGRYAVVLAPAGSSVSSVEYYLTATDNRNQTRCAPGDAPQKTFVVSIPGENRGGTPGGERVDCRLSIASGCWLLEWKSEPGVDWYEIHRTFPPDLSDRSLTFLARQSPVCPRFLLPPESQQGLDKDSICVIAVRGGHKDAVGMADRK
jgi:hypothetical protein